MTAGRLAGAGKIGVAAFFMLFYRAALPLSRQTLTFTARLIRRYRASVGSVWRKLNAGQQALLVLVHLRKGEPFAQVAAGFGVGATAAWRYITDGSAAGGPCPQAAAGSAGREESEPDVRRPGRHAGPD